MHSRRGRLAVAVALLAVGLTTALPAAPATAVPHGDARGGWSAGWASAPQHPVPGNEWDGPNWSTEGFRNQSVRQVVRLSVGGSRLRIRLSNRYGTGPLRVSGATIGRTTAGAAVRPGTVRRLTFGRSAGVTIPAGRDVATDVVFLRTRPLERLTVTLYLAGSTGPATFHENGLTTTYRAAGDHRYDRDGRAFAGEVSDSWYYLTGVDVAGGPRPGRGTVVTLGDSITDGYGSTSGADNRYPDQLAERLAAAGVPMGVANVGINGNKLLTDSTCYGESMLTRFRRDVLDQPGVRTVIVAAGINDLGTSELPDFGCGPSPKVDEHHLVAGYRALIHIARARGITVVGTTLSPVAGSVYGRAEESRVAVNHWIRSSGEFDAVADVDRALADPEGPGLRPAYDCGDRLHPNDAGAQAIADAIELRHL
ncbi:Lysophospholipase L1 [Micromonospora citrea]|uniref:Lysophospholipase L1 n=1 Tax=Micromonospora citrea TaxID=47855 RepID=A0A1C6TXP6_9ACTN|nr:SGNH/GDSL hydrolase family protein [Micromonospora citrea]SCL46517.1 Lysophospholipase L1 [Micromonospora citrea]